MLINQRKPYEIRKPVFKKLKLSSSFRTNLLEALGNSDIDSHNLEEVLGNSDIDSHNFGEALGNSDIGSDNLQEALGNSDIEFDNLQEALGNSVFDAYTRRHFAEAGVAPFEAVLLVG